MTEKMSRGARVELRITRKLKEDAQRVADSLEMSLSEYIKYLMRSDVDRRSIKSENPHGNEQDQPPSRLP